MGEHKGAIEVTITVRFTRDQRFAINDLYGLRGQASRETLESWGEVSRHCGRAIR